MSELFHEDRWLTIIEGDCRASLRTLPADSVHAIVTSPPYWGLRDYGIPPVTWADGWSGQLGLEPSPQMYVAHLVEVMAECRRVLHRSGTLWLNLGDSYMSNGASQVPDTIAGKRELSGRAIRPPRVDGIKAKDLVGIPWLAAFALRADGWYLRRDVVWSKPNPMPESTDDRPSSSHEYMFMLTREPDYYYDRVAVLEPDVAGHRSGNGFKREARISGGLANGRERDWQPGGGRNRRSVWTIPTRPYPGAHFAVFPPKLVEPPIMASTSDKGVCPECGAQWVRQVAQTLVVDHEVTRTRPAIDHGPAGTQLGGDVVGTNEFETLGWRPGCGHGWGGDPDDLDIIASPNVPHRAAEIADVAAGRLDAQRRRGLARDRLDDEGRRFITRFEQRSYARQLRAWDGDRRMAALDEIAGWLGHGADVDRWRATSPAGPHPAEDAWRHYLRADPRGARAIPKALFEAWLDRGWLTRVEPPDYSGALAPVPAVVLDPFGGSGTVGLVAQQLGRRAVLMDINAGYLRQQMARASREFGTGGSYATEAEPDKPHPEDSLWAATDG